MRDKVAEAIGLVRAYDGDTFDNHLATSELQRCADAAIAAILAELEAPSVELSQAVDAAICEADCGGMYTPSSALAFAAIQAAAAHLKR